MKKFLLILLSAIVLSISANAVSLYIDTQKLETDTPPVVIDGRTLVPVRAIFESLGAEVSWNQDTQTAIGTRDGTRIVIKINDTIAYVDGVPYTLDVPAQLVNNRTMVPARFISESLNCDVTWDQDTKTASVANAMKGQKIYATDTGNKFHYNSNCNGGTYYEVTLAEALGRGLSACEKCIGAEAEEPNNVSGTGQIVDVSQYFYFDNSGKISNRGNIGLGSEYVLAYNVNGDIYVDENSLVPFLANILEEENLNKGQTIITNDPNLSYYDFPNLSWETIGSKVQYTYKDVEFSYSLEPNAPENVINEQNGCRVINRFGAWVFNANDLSEIFGAGKTIYINGDYVVIQ